MADHHELKLAVLAVALCFFCSVPFGGEPRPVEGLPNFLGRLKVCEEKRAELAKQEIRTIAILVEEIGLAQSGVPVTGGLEQAKRSLSELVPSEYRELIHDRDPWGNPYVFCST